MSHTAHNRVVGKGETAELLPGHPGPGISAVVGTWVI